MVQNKLGQGEVDMQTKGHGSTAMYGTTLQCEMFHEKTGLDTFLYVLYSNTASYAAAPTIPLCRRTLRSNPGLL
jgi:hypothetical protein